MHQGFIGRPRPVQGLLMSPTAGAPGGPERRTSPVTGVAVALASAVPLLLSGPFVAAVTDRGTGGVTPPGALPLIGIPPCAASREVFPEGLLARPSVGVVAHPQPRLARRPRDEAAKGRASRGRGAVPLALRRAPGRRLCGGARRGAVVPPRAETAPPPPRRGRSARGPRRSR